MAEDISVMNKCKKILKCSRFKVFLFDSERPGMFSNFLNHVWVNGYFENDVFLKNILLTEVFKNILLT